MLYMLNKITEDGAVPIDARKGRECMTLMTVALCNGSYVSTQSIC